MLTIEQAKAKVTERKLKAYDFIVMTIRTFPEEDMKLVRKIILEEAAKVSTDVAKIYDRVPE